MAEQETNPGAIYQRRQQNAEQAFNQLEPTFEQQYNYLLKTNKQPLRSDVPRELDLMLLAAQYAISGTPIQNSDFKPELLEQLLVPYLLYRPNAVAGFSQMNIKALDFSLIADTQPSILPKCNIVYFGNKGQWTKIYLIDIDYPVQYENGQQFIYVGSITPQQERLLENGRQLALPYYRQNRIYQRNDFQQKHNVSQSLMRSPEKIFPQSRFWPRPIGQEGQETVRQYFERILREMKGEYLTVLMSTPFYQKYGINTPFETLNRQAREFLLDRYAKARICKNVLNADTLDEAWEMIYSSFIQSMRQALTQEEQILFDRFVRWSAAAQKVYPPDLQQRVEEQIKFIDEEVLGKDQQRLQKLNASSNLTQWQANASTNYARTSLNKERNDYLQRAGYGPAEEYRSAVQGAQIYSDIVGHALSAMGYTAIRQTTGRQREKGTILLRVMKTFLLTPHIFLEWL
ncbi:MAG TPA: hypothetical protein VGT05_02860 [Patescibacteria group bacterium]|nr:hypothetical protein [Patescibacteria group bacterium]